MWAFLADFWCQFAHRRAWYHLYADELACPLCGRSWVITVDGRKRTGRPPWMPRNPLLEALKQAAEHAEPSTPREET